MSWKEFDRATRFLARRIQKSKIKYSALCGIPRGGLMVAIRLSHLLDIPLTESESLDFMNKNILIVDDVADTGKTLQFYVLYGYPTATLYWNPESSIQPKFWIKRKSPKEWIIFPWESKD